MEQQLIYIAGKYSAPTKEEKFANTKEAILAGINVHKKGHVPYIPHLNHFFDMECKKINYNLTWYDYMEMCMVMLKRCDALLYLSPSKGADIEYFVAREIGLPVYHFIEQIPFACKK